MGLQHIGSQGLVGRLQLRNVASSAKIGRRGTNLTATRLYPKELEI